MAYDGFFADISTRSSVNEVLLEAEAIKNQVDALYQGTQTEATNAANSAITAKNEADRAQRIADSINGENPPYGTRQESPFDPEFGAKGDGVTDDTAAFAAFEAKYVGMTIDLGFAKCKVSAIPTKNVYQNGSWLIPGDPNQFTRFAFEGDTVNGRPALYHPYGGGLNRLKKALTDVLNQYVGVVWIGDSITWGSGNQPECAPFDPRNGTLKDPRDWFGTNSYVNNMRRYLIDQYLPGSTVTVEGWEQSPWGHPIVKAVKDIVTMPIGNEFSRTIIGSTVTITDEASPSLPAKWRLLISNGNTVDGDNAYGSVSFKFTGSSFRLHLGCVNDTASDYQIFIDGASIGRFSTADGATIDNGELEDNSSGTRTHTFPFVSNALVEIRALRPLLPGGSPTKVLRIHGLIIPKTLRLTNNGINGSSLYSYRLYNLPPTCWTYSESCAVNAGDQFCFVQLGTNDRGTIRGPQTTNYIQTEAKNLLDAIPSYCVPILMVSNPAIPVVGANLQQSDIRNALHMVARERAVDFVDNYGIFQGMDRLAYAKDQLHPNQWGYSVMATNIIKALEASVDTSVTPPEPPLETFAVKPDDAIFTVTAPSGTQVIDRDSSAAYLGRQRLYRMNATNGGDIYFEFAAKGKDFGIAYSSLSTNILDYEVLVDGVSQGRFSTKYLEAGGGTTVYRNIRWHSIPDDSASHTIRIVGKYRPDFPGTTQVLYIEAVLYKQGGGLSAVGGTIPDPEPPEVVQTLLPTDPRFVPHLPAGTQIVDREAPAARLGVQRLYRAGTSPSGDCSVSFNVKGPSFGFAFSATASNMLDYQLFIDGVSQGTFSMVLGEVGGAAASYQNERFHNVPNDGGTHAVQMIFKRRATWPEATHVAYLEAFLAKEGVTIT